MVQISQGVIFLNLLTVYTGLDVNNYHRNYIAGDY